MTPLVDRPFGASPGLGPRLLLRIPPRGRDSATGLPVGLHLTRLTPANFSPILLVNSLHCQGTLRRSEIGSRV